MIIAAAVLVKNPKGDSHVFVGRRHGDAQRNAYKLMGIDTEQSEWQRLTFCKDGFLTSDLRFLTREQALPYAKECGQFHRYDNTIQPRQPFDPKLDYDGPQLFSEDLW
jgi:hypothetical protein